MSRGELSAWIPRLLAVWRRARASGGGRGGGRTGGRGGHRPPPGRSPEGPPDALTREELQEVAQGVKQLSLGLTRDRALAGARYMDDPRLLGAYLLFYWPVSYAQGRAALAEVGKRPRAVLDLGAGPGPLAFAALDAGAREVVAADRSRPALELARALAVEASEPLGTREWSPERPLPEGRFDLITLGHVLNELHGGDVAQRAALVERLLERLTPGGSVLVVEPALKETSRALLQVRDLLVGRGVVVRAPCLFRGPCPALVKPTDWCHAERPWQPPPLVEALARAAGLHKEALKMSYLVLASRGEAWAELPEGRHFRIVSEALEGKGRQRFMGCGPEGRVGLAMQERHRSPANQRFFGLQRGDVVRITGTEERGDGLALGETSTLEVVASAGRAFPPGQRQED